MTAPQVFRAADVIARAMRNHSSNPMLLAEALESAQLLQSPETAAELQRLRDELALSEQRSERRRIAWRMARQRAISIGSAADRYAARAQAGQTALQDLLASLLEAQIERDAARARVAELEAERHSTNEALDDAVKALRAAEGRSVDEDPIAYTLTDAPTVSGACKACGSAPDSWCPDCGACQKGCYDGHVDNPCTHANASWKAAEAGGAS
jgi:hypothetical protein